MRQENGEKLSLIDCDVIQFAGDKKLHFLSSAKSVWQDGRPKSSPKTSKVAKKTGQTIFTLKVMLFRKPKQFTKYLGYFSIKICGQELQKFFPICSRCLRCSVVLPNGYGVDQSRAKFWFRVWQSKSKSICHPFAVSLMAEMDIKWNVWNGKCHLWAVWPEKNRQISIKSCS